MLVITIIVIVILAVAVILTLSQNNPIESAKKAVFQNDLKTIQEDVNMYKMTTFSNTKGESSGNLTISGEEMLATFPSISEKYKNKIEIIDGEVVLKGDNATDNEKEWAKEIGISVVGFGTNGSTNVNAAKVNAPKLLTGMKAIKFDASGNTISTTVDDPEWYEYVNQGTYTTDGKTSKWANAKTEDGSQWVWIPRYAYKITTAGTSTASEIDVKFLKGTSNKYVDENGVEQELPSGYIVHPAFTDESSTNYANGGWDRELTGIWVAKYEAGFAGQ